MSDKPDITIHFPAEHFDSLMEIMAIGIQHAKLKTPVRQELRDWWEAEKEFLLDEIGNPDQSAK